MNVLQPYLDRLTPYLQNQYVIGVIAILSVVYGSLMAPRLPPRVANLFANPVFKILFIFLILAVRKIHPSLSIVLALALIISIQTLNRYRIFGMANEVSQITAKADKPMMNASQEELAQLSLEATDALRSDKGSELKRDRKATVTEAEPEGEASQSVNALHPLNRPTAETDMLSTRIEDPNDPRLSTPVDNEAVYDLNPPFIATSQNVSPFARQRLTRYSAHKGHDSIQPLESDGRTSYAEPMVKPVYLATIMSNLPYPLVTAEERRLPMNFGDDPVLPAPPGQAREAVYATRQSEL